MRMQMMAGGLLLTIAAALAPQASQAGELIIGVAPPAPRVEVIPAARVGYVWSPGYWRWYGGRHVWVNGYYVHERVGWHWRPAHWVESGGRWHYVGGVWVR